jgi:hypothetical protein
MVLHSYIRTKQITNSTYMKKQILLHVLYLYNNAKNRMVQFILYKKC